MTDTGTHGERQKALMLVCGIKLWRQSPDAVSARRIAKMMDMTHHGVLYHFGTSAAMRDAIAYEAVRVGDPVIVPMLIVSRHSAADGLSAADRLRYLAGC